MAEGQCCSLLSTSLSDAFKWAQGPSCPLMAQNLECQNLTICGYFQLEEGHREISRRSGNRLAAVWTQPTLYVLRIITWSKNRIRKQTISADSSMNIWLQDVDGAERGTQTALQQRKGKTSWKSLDCGWWKAIWADFCSAISKPAFSNPPQCVISLCLGADGMLWFWRWHMPLVWAIYFRVNNSKQTVVPVWLELIVER